MLQESTLPSPGEIRKLMFAYAVLNNPSLIILDEPTNHMDLDSILLLQSALTQYNGALIVVSHDKAFYEAFADTLWEVKKRGKNTTLCKHIRF